LAIGHSSFSWEIGEGIAGSVCRGRRLGPPFASLGEAVATRTGVDIECRVLDDVEIAYGWDGRAARLSRVPGLRPVRSGTTSPIGDTLLPPSPSSGEPAAQDAGL